MNNAFRTLAKGIAALPVRERYMLAGFTALLIVGIVWGASGLIDRFATTVPREGGTYREGMIGQPRFVNPILAQANDVDMDIARIVYSGLLKRSPEGILKPDLATSIEVSEDKKTYTVYIRDDVLWHDGTPFTAHDVVFTIATIQDPDTKSPIASNFQNVEVHRDDDYTVRFVLPDPYPMFQESLTTGIAPRHIWMEIEPKNIALAEHNLKPVGTGPFMFSELRKRSQGDINEYSLERFQEYYENPAYLSTITFEFFADYDSLVEAFRRKRIDGISSISPLQITHIENISHAHVHRIRLPQYSAVFFNQQQNSVLAEKAVRHALLVAVDREQLIQNALRGEGIQINTPIPSGFRGHNPEIHPPDPDTEAANTILEDAGWKMGENGIREKDGSQLTFTLSTTTWEEYAQTAEILAETWKSIGVEVHIATYESGIIQNDVIRSREYEALLYGHVLSADPDPYVFWHSRFADSPGMNLAKYDNREADKLLEAARTEVDPDARQEKYHAFQKIVAEDIPALFLYAPYYVFAINESVQGSFMEIISTPSERFDTISTWYTRTRRVFRTKSPDTTSHTTLRNISVGRKILRESSAETGIAAKRAIAQNLRESQ